MLPFSVDDMARVAWTILVRRDRTCLMRQRRCKQVSLWCAVGMMADGLGVQNVHAIQKCRRAHIDVLRALVVAEHTADTPHQQQRRADPQDPDLRSNMDIRHKVSRVRSAKATRQGTMTKHA